MNRQHKNNIFSTILTGYKNIFIRFIKIFLVAGIIPGLAFILLYPLWYSALHYTRIYSYAVSGLLAAGGIFLAVKSVLKRITGRRESGRSFFSGIKHSAIQTGKILLFGGYFYTFALLIYRHHYGKAAGTLILFLFITGYLLFGRKQADDT